NHQFPGNFRPSLCQACVFRRTAFKNAGLLGSSLENAWLSDVQGCSLTIPNVVPVCMGFGAPRRMLLPCSQAPEPVSPARAARAGVECWGGVLGWSAGVECWGGVLGWRGAAK